MIRRLFSLSIAVAAVCCTGAAFAEDAATIEKGKAVYDSAKPACKACHLDALTQYLLSLKK